jgi:hypothetical protein
MTRAGQIQGQGQGRGRGRIIVVFHLFFSLFFSVSRNRSLSKSWMTMSKVLNHTGFKSSSALVLFLLKPNFVDILQKVIKNSFTVMTTHIHVFKTYLFRSICLEISLFTRVFR